MKIKITASGIFGQDGEIPVGTEFEVDIEPKAWVGRYEVIKEDASAEAVSVTNPKK